VKTAVRIILICLALSCPAMLAGHGWAQAPDAPKSVEELKKEVKDKRRAWLRYQLDEDGPEGGSVKKAKVYNEAKAKALKEYKDAKAALHKAQSALSEVGQ